MARAYDEFDNLIFESESMLYEKLDEFVQRTLKEIPENTERLEFIKLRIKEVEEIIKKERSENTN